MTSPRLEEYAQRAKLPIRVTTICRGDHFWWNFITPGCDQCTDHLLTAHVIYQEAVSQTSRNTTSAYLQAVKELTE